MAEVQSLSIASHGWPVARASAWIFTCTWLIAVALLFASVPSQLQPDLGPLLVVFSLATASALGVAFSVHVRPSASRLIALIVALVSSLLFTWRDLNWIQGAGRTDGQAGLVWLDPALILVLAYPVVLATAAVIERARARIVRGSR